nr:hypothetical protein [Tanacetum cinerariifolium]
MELKKILIEKMEGNKDDEIRKDPPLDQTEGRRDEEKVGSLNQLAFHPNQQPEVQAELEYHLEEVYKATTDQLGWVNPKEDDCMRETSGCFKGPYDSSYAVPIFTE